MSLVATTLVDAIDGIKTVMKLASVAGFSNALPINYSATAKIPYLFYDQEISQVVSIGPSVANGTLVNVIRGVQGTCALPHGANIPVVSGFAADFSGFVPAQGLSTSLLPTGSEMVSAPVAGSANVVATGGLFHLSGTIAMVNLTAPPGYLAGPGYLGGGAGITIIFDGSAAGLTWTAAGNISAAGTATTAGSAVTFIFDISINKWIPHRVS